jgi:hypothetical protein
LRRVHSRQLKVSEKEFVAYDFGPGSWGAAVLRPYVGLLRRDAVGEMGR